MLSRLLNDTAELLVADTGRKNLQSSVARWLKAQQSMYVVVANSSSYTMHV
jgi:hypothetical protein